MVLFQWFYCYLNIFPVKILVEALLQCRRKFLLFDDFTLNQLFLLLIFEYFDIFIYKANRNRHCLLLGLLRVLQERFLKKKFLFFLVLILIRIFRLIKLYISTIFIVKVNRNRHNWKNGGAKELYWVFHITWWLLFRRKLL